MKRTLLSSKIVLIPFILLMLTLISPIINVSTNQCEKEIIAIQKIHQVSTLRFEQKHFTTTASNILTINEFSHNNRPIYANFTIIELVMKLESAEASIANLFLHYSHNLVDWTTQQFSKSNTLTANSSLFTINAGPFLYSGNYYLKINATRGSLQLAEVLFIISVEEVFGIVFTDFTYQLVQSNNGSQAVNVQIFVYGKNINSSSVEVEFDQPDETNTTIPMTLIPGTTNHYNATVYKIEQWLEIVHLIFRASILGEQYTNNNYYFVKGLPIFPEDFLTQKLPAIIVGIIGVGSMAGIFILARRKPPKSFD